MAKSRVCFVTYMAKTLFLVISHVTERTSAFFLSLSNKNQAGKAIRSIRRMNYSQCSTNLKILNLKICRFGRFRSNPESESVSTFGHQSNQKTESKIFGGIPNPESRIRILWEQPESQSRIRILNGEKSNLPNLKIRLGYEPSNLMHTSEIYQYNCQ